MHAHLTPPILPAFRNREVVRIHHALKKFELLAARLFHQTYSSLPYSPPLPHLLALPIASGGGDVGEKNGGARMRSRIRSMAMAIIFLIAVTLLSACSTLAPQDAMQADVEQAAAIIERFQSFNPDQAIPPAILRSARGLANHTVTKSAFIGSVRGGTGVVVARTQNGWSGPSAIGTGGLGVGLQAGAEVSEFVIVLNTPAAIDAFARGGNVTLGGNLTIAAGPMGRSAEAGVSLQAAMYSYSQSQGLFAGISLEGTVIGTRDELNEAYYGRPVAARDILAGKEQPPARAERLLAVLPIY
jgi:lipid-binding SYLF domain-containing protein